MVDNQKEKIDRLIRLRKKLGLTQAQMAEVINVSQPKLSAIEKGKEGRHILNSISFILKEKLKVNIEWFETGEGDMFMQTNEISDNYQNLSNMDASYEIQSLKDQLRSKIENNESLKETIETMKETIQLLKEANQTLKLENQELKKVLSQKGSDDSLIPKAG